MILNLGLLKSKGFVGDSLGSELVTNGDFDSATGWTTGGSWVISGGQASATVGFDTLQQINVVPVGIATFRFFYDFPTGAIRVKLGTSGFTSPLSGTDSIDITTDGSAGLLAMQGTTVPCIAESVSVRKIG